MQDQIRDSLIACEGIISDSIVQQQSLFIESKPLSAPEFRENLYSTNLNRDKIPDWYFIVILLVLSGFALARVVFGKFLNSIWVCAFSYQTASKIYKEQSVVQKRFSMALDLLYLINASLFLYLLNIFFAPGLFVSVGILFVFQAFLFLFILVFLRIIVMRITAFIFDQSRLFLGFLYHYFIYNKVLGMVLIPFLVAIPYTLGTLQEVIVYTGISTVFIIYIFRLFRAIVYVVKNVVLLFYLILYLCILEILPVLVVIKLLLSLEQA
jgi:hypothetical protein